MPRGLAAVLLIAVLRAAIGLTSLQANRAAQASIRRALLVTRAAVDHELGGRTRALSRAGMLLANVPLYRERLLNRRDREAALDQADALREGLDAAWVLVTDSDGMLIARTDYPERYGQDLALAPLVASALSGVQTSGAWIEDTGTMFIAAGTPLRDHPNATPRGALVASFQIGDSLARQLERITGTGIVFFVLDTLGRPVVAGHTLGESEVEAVLGNVDRGALVADSGGEGTLLTADVDGRHLIGLAGPIRSPGGDVRGGFVLLRSSSTLPQTTGNPDSPSIPRAARP